MQNADIFMGLFFAIGLGFSVMALWARGQMRLERQFVAAARNRRSHGGARSLREIDREIAELKALRDQLAAR